MNNFSDKTKSNIKTYSSNDFLEAIMTKRFSCDTDPFTCPMILYTLYSCFKTGIHEVVIIIKWYLPTCNWYLVSIRKINFRKWYFSFFVTYTLINEKPNDILLQNFDLNSKWMKISLVSFCTLYCNPHFSFRSFVSISSSHFILNQTWEICHDTILPPYDVVIFGAFKYSESV